MEANKASAKIIGTSSLATPALDHVSVHAHANKNKGNKESTDEEPLIQMVECRICYGRILRLIVMKSH